MHSVHKMPATATDGVAWSVCLSVCLSVGHVREPNKTAEPIEMLFEALIYVTYLGPKTMC